MEIFHNLEKPSEVQLTQGNPASLSFFNGVLRSIIVIIIITCKKGKVRKISNKYFLPYVLFE